ncbi:hypothetical protein BS78_06G083100 [Paspalum vaginatum]|nr:hypothetical protein BS78_06G083100 [Paspalum vaginatum]
MAAPLQRHAGDADLISDLPSELLSAIISRLATAEAARTAVLSTRWRGTPLRLDDLELPAAPHPSIARVASAAGTPWAARADTISLALASHGGPVARFRLARTTLRTRVPTAEAWFRDLAADRRAREVSLVCPPEWCHLALADPLLASPTLETLALGECRFSDAGAASAAAFCLTELSLSRTHISEAALQSLLSGCPALRSVMLRHIQGPGRIRINSCRSLVLLGVWQYRHLEELTVEDAPRLDCLLGDVDLRAAVTIIGAPKLTALGYLVVGFRDFFHRIGTPAAQEDKQAEDNVDTIDSVYYQKLDPIGCIVNHLKNARLETKVENQRSTAEMRNVFEFVCFLLANAQVLQIMKIQFAISDTPAWIAEHENLLSQYYRASAEAKVVFEDLKFSQRKGFSIEAVNALPDPFNGDIDILGY